MMITLPTTRANPPNTDNEARAIVHRWASLASLAAAAAVVVSCSGSDGAGTSTGGERGIGGSNEGQGGVAASGGTTTGLGSSSAVAAGGHSALTGGTRSLESTSAITITGGSGAAGTRTSMGGSIATSGSNSIGGIPAMGGDTAVSGTPGGSNSTATSRNGGGNTATGGRTNTNGSITTGGIATAGNTASGGTKAIGGSIHAGGSLSTGGITSTSTTDPINLPAGVTALFPAPGSQNTCADPILRVTFSGAPTLGSTGSIRVFDSSGKAVATIDMSLEQSTDTIGGRSFTILRPVYVDGNTVSIRLPSNGLSYGQTYYVNIGSGALSSPSGGLTITNTDTWRFTTAASAPTNLSAISVATDDSGQFCTVQGALNAIPANNSIARTITVHPGIYHEIIYFTRKDNITIQGTDRDGTVISATNNNNVNPSTQGRALFGVDSVTGLQIKSITIYNLTPQGGSQAEALRVQKCDQCVIRNATIKSLQDTLLWSGRVYADGCLIQGNVDYVWGTGVAYFNRCEIRTVGRTGVIVQSRNDAGAYGYVFVDSKLTADSAATNNMLARIDVSAYPGSHVAYIGCQMTNVGAAGWTITGGTPSSSLRFWEYQSTDSAGNPINVSQRVSGSTQISATEAAQMRDPSVVLGGWQPPTG